MRRVQGSQASLPSINALCLHALCDALHIACTVVACTVFVNTVLGKKQMLYCSFQAWAAHLEERVVLGAVHGLHDCVQRRIRVHVRCQRCRPYLVSRTGHQTALVLCVRQHN